MRHKKITAEPTPAITWSMRNLGFVMLGISIVCGPMQAADQDHGVMVGTVDKVDAGAKTVAVKTADGTEHTLAFTGHTVVHGAKDSTRGAEDASHGLENGSKVVVHYTAKGGKETADEVDKIGEDGLKGTKVTVTHVDRAAKTVSVETADGAKDTYKVTDRAADEIGKEVAKGTERTAKGTVYFTEDAGHKVVHFFERI